MWLVPQFHAGGSNNASIAHANLTKLNSLNLNHGKASYQNRCITKKRKCLPTKRILIRATNKATSKLATDAMKLKGYIVKAEGKWIVRIDNTGRRTRLAQISDLNSADKVAPR
jgi:hypothetical protein